MAEITFDGVTKIFGDDVRAVDQLSLHVADGEFMVLVGPSGCGKTTALRMLAGLEDITEGSLSIGGVVVNNVLPKDRDVAMVFQNYALYPHMTVAEPTSRDGPSDRAQSTGLLDGRAALEPRRPAPRRDAPRDRAHPATARRGDRLRDARSDRGDDDGRSSGGHARRAAPTVRHAPGPLRPSAQRIRRRLHGFTTDESASRRIRITRRRRRADPGRTASRRSFELHHFTRSAESRWSGRGLRHPT